MSEVVVRAVIKMEVVNEGSHGMGVLARSLYPIARLLPPSITCCASFIVEPFPGE